MTITRVGVLGGSLLGQTFAKTLARSGIASIVGSGGTGESLAPLVADLRGLTAAGTLGEAAAEDIVFLAVRWSELAETLGPIADWEGRILIDATDPTLPGVGLLDLGGKTSSEVVSDLAQGAQVVKAFNTLPPEVLVEWPRLARGRRVVFFSGDHVRAKFEVGRLIAQLGFAGVDLGGLSAGGRLQQFPDGPLWGQNLIRLEDGTIRSVPPFAMYSQAEVMPSSFRASFMSAVSKPSANLA